MIGWVPAFASPSLFRAFIHLRFLAMAICQHLVQPLRADEEYRPINAEVMQRVPCF